MNTFGRVCLLSWCFSLKCETHVCLAASQGLADQSLVPLIIEPFLQFKNMVGDRTVTVHILTPVTFVESNMSSGRLFPLKMLLFIGAHIA